MSAPQHCRVLLVDDHAVVRTGYRTLLEQSNIIRIVGEAENGTQAYAMAQELQPDAIVMDISMPGMSGLETTRKIVQRYPQARILVFSMHEDMAYVEQALQAGAIGYLPKSSPPEVLINAITTIATGESFIEEGIAKRLSNKGQRGADNVFDDFSTREFEIFCLLATGKNTSDIADMLNISAKTVANYTTQIKSKLEISNQAELVHVAIRNGIIKMAES